MLKFFNSNSVESIRRFFIKILPVLFFLFLGAIFLRGVLFSPGVILGSDWGLPFTNQQIQEYFANGFTTWTNQMNLLGGQQPFSVSLWFQSLMKLWSLLRLSGQLFLKLWLLGLFLLGGYSMYLLARFLKCYKLTALLSGFIFITTPPFFNYSIMGWTNVLFALSIFPLAIITFIKAVQERKISYSIITGLLYALAVIQSQSLVWYPLIFLALSFYLIKNKKTFWYYLKSLAITLAIGLILHSVWLIPLFLCPVSSILGSGLTTVEMSKGTWVYLSHLNIFRLWGGLVNHQYEFSYPKVLEVFSFVVPAVVLLALLLFKKRKIVISLTLIFLIPAFLFDIGYDLISKIPFSNLIRDVARFSVLSTLAYAVLFALLFNFLYQSKKKYFKILAFVLCLATIINALPFFLGQLVGKPKFGADVRLRTYEFPTENLQVENLTNDLMLNSKILYLPIGEVMDLKNNARFHGIFRGVRDLFAIYSHHPGGITFYQSGLGSPQQFSIELDKMLVQKRFAELGKMLSLISIRHLVLRTDIDHPINEDSQAFISSFNKQDYIDQFLGKNFGSIFIFQNDYFLPHFYTPQSIITSSDTIDKLRDIISQKDYQIRSAIYFESQNKNNLNEKLNQLKLDLTKEQSSFQELIVARTVKLPVLEFKKINLTKYRVIVHRAKDSFPLVFSESFHKEWKAYLVESGKLKVESGKLLDYKILDGNKEDQANKEEIEEFIEKGWVSNLGDGKEKEIKHKKYLENGKEVVGRIEKYKIDFVSKNFQDTIQNDNLPGGHIWDTWFQKPLLEENHLTANGYANSWIIDTEKICQENSDKCVKNPDGSYDFELIVEFWPQRLFYLGLFISGMTLLGCLGYLGYDWKKRRRNNIRSVENENEK